MGTDLKWVIDLNSMIDGVIAVDKDAKITAINPPAEQIFNIPKDAAKGKFFLEVIRNNEIYETIDAVLKTASGAAREFNLIWPVRKDLKINASPILENSAVMGCLLVIHDITEIRRLETIRSDFVANVSHELKTPLTSIKGFVETLLDGALDDKENSRHFLKIIQDHTNRLDSLINDLLTLSHVESKEIRLDKEEFYPRDLADRVLSGFKSQLAKKDIRIKNDISSGALVMADRNRIEQVFINLIDNAIKFSREDGDIKIYNEKTDSGLRFVVEDTGIGIPAKDVSRIFERFYRVDKARSRELGGTGLGLSIVKHIIELHGGNVGVESTEGLGSKFWFTLPK